METTAQNASIDGAGPARSEQRSFPSIRQLLEGMTLVFDPQAAGDMNATIQFVVSAPQPGQYWLEIKDRSCAFHVGKHAAPTLTITTPSDVWLKIAEGQLNSQQALMQGMYSASGEFGLLLKMASLFKPAAGVSVDAPRDQRPGGPLAISGMAWMTVAFVPTILYWISFGAPVSPWVGIGMPLFLSLALIGYRLKYDRPTWLEIGVALMFVVIAVLELVPGSALSRRGGAFGSMAMAGIWLSSLVIDRPVSAEYAKWSVVKPLWSTSLFIHPNAVISLVWGWQFVAAALLGMAAIWLPAISIPLKLAQYGLIAPAAWFTTWYQKGVRTRRVADVEAAIRRVRLLGGLGLAATAAIACATWLWL